MEDLTTAIKAAIAIATGTAPKHDRTSMLEWEAPVNDDIWADNRTKEHNTQSPDKIYQKMKEDKASQEEKDRRYGKTGTDPELISAEAQPLGNVNPRILPVERKASMFQLRR